MLHQCGSKRTVHLWRSHGFRILIAEEVTLNGNTILHDSTVGMKKATVSLNTCIPANVNSIELLESKCKHSPQEFYVPVLKRIQPHVMGVVGTSVPRLIQVNTEKQVML